MNIFKMLQKSRKNGLLSEGSNIGLVSILILGVLAVVIILIVRVSSYDSSLPLRYSTLDGYYDQGRWIRPYVVAVFTSLMAALHIAIASLMWRQKNYYSAKALLVVPLVLVAILVFISLNIVTATTL